MSRYVAPFVPGELNEAFWREVLVNRTIRDVLFGPDGRLDTLVLDDGQVVKITSTGVLLIED